MTTNIGYEFPDNSGEIESLRQQLAECQAREKVLRDALALSWSEEYVNGIVARSKARDALALPSDSTALDTMLKAAKREALLSIAKYGKNMDGIFDKAFGAGMECVADEAIRMAKELE